LLVKTKDRASIVQSKPQLIKSKTPISDCDLQEIKKLCQAFTKPKKNILSDGAMEQCCNATISPKKILEENVSRISSDAKETTIYYPHTTIQ
jgi:hypothetical protein